MKKKFFILFLALSLLSCQTKYNMYYMVGYDFGVNKEDDFYPCELDENGEIKEILESKSAFDTEIISYVYLKDNQKNAFQDKLKKVKEKAIYQSVCFDSRQLYVDKNKNLVHNLAYLNLYQNKDEFINVEKETFNLLKIALEITKYTEGYFNFCIGNVSLLWDNFIKNGSPIPSENEINNALKNIPKYNELDDIFIFDENNCSVKINSKYKIDLTFNALAKGYFLETIKNDLINDKLLINAGSSSISTYGNSLNGDWQISIRNPNYNNDEEEQENYLKIHKNGMFSLSVSGDYQNYKMQDNIRYHHIINPFTGYPTSLHRSTVVIGDNATYADALSTVLMMLKIEDAKNLLSKISQEKNYNFKFIIIDEEDSKIIYNVQKEIDYASLKPQKDAVISYF